MSNKNVFDVGLSYPEDIPKEIVQQFTSILGNKNLRVECAPRSQSTYMALEWAVPTLIATYLAKPFFDAFLHEAGKDSYAALKSGLLFLFERLFGPEPHRQDKKRISLLFSIHFQDHLARPVKCVFPEGVERADYVKMLDGLYDLLVEDTQTQADGRLYGMLSQVEAFGGFYVLEFSRENVEWVAIDVKKEIQDRVSCKSE